MDLEQNTTVYQTKVSCSTSEIHSPKLNRKNEVPWNCPCSSVQSKSLNTKQIIWTRNASLTIESLGWRILFVILSFLYPRESWVLPLHQHTLVGLYNVCIDK